MVLFFVNDSISRSCSIGGARVESRLHFKLTLPSSDDPFPGPDSELPFANTVSDKIETEASAKDIVRMYVIRGSPHFSVVWVML